MEDKYNDQNLLNARKVLHAVLQLKDPELELHTCIVTLITIAQSYDFDLSKLCEVFKLYCNESSKSSEALINFKKVRDARRPEKDS